MSEMVWKNDQSFVTVGPKHLKIWTVILKVGAKRTDSVDKILQPKQTNPEYFLDIQKGVWGKNPVSNILNTVVINKQDIIAGA